MKVGACSKDYSHLKRDGGMKAALLGRYNSKLLVVQEIMHVSMSIDIYNDHSFMLEFNFIYACHGWHVSFGRGEASWIHLFYVDNTACMTEELLLLRFFLWITEGDGD